MLFISSGAFVMKFPEIASTETSEQKWGGINVFYTHTSLPHKRKGGVLTYDMNYTGNATNWRFKPILKKFGYIDLGIIL